MAPSSGRLSVPCCAYSQRFVAERLHMVRNTLGRLERGGPVRLATLEVCAQAIEAKLDVVPKTERTRDAVEEDDISERAVGAKVEGILKRMRLRRNRAPA